MKIRAVVFGLGIAMAAIGGNALATEEAPYVVSLQAGAFEVRDYPGLIAAEVSVAGDRDAAVNAGFRLLAGYIFGGNTRRQSIAMTAPVIQTVPPSEAIAMTAPVIQIGEPGSWVVRFVMPSGYTLETLPIPNDPQVELKELPAARFAVVRFSGLANEPDIEKKTAELIDFIATEQLQIAGPASLARFNPPWTLWFLRRNEVMIPVLRM